MVENPFSS